MRFNEKDFEKLKKINPNNLTIKEIVSYNILNFINTINKNEQDFYASNFRSHFYGDIEMIFKKKSGSLIGNCKVKIKSKDIELEYLFTEAGFELLSDVVSY